MRTPVRVIAMLLLGFVARPATGATLTQTITFDDPADQAYQTEPISLQASANSGLPVDFSVVAGPASIAGNQLELHGTGVVKVRAAQAGNAAYYAAPSVEQSFIVSRGPVAITLSGLAATYTGQPQAAIAMTEPAGLPVTLTYNGSSDVPTAAGSYTVQAVVDTPLYSGSTTAAMTVGKAPGAIDFPVLADRPFRHWPFTLVATGRAPTTIVFSVVSGPASVSNSLPASSAGDAGAPVTSIDPTVIGFPGPTNVEPWQNEYLTVTGTGTVVVRAAQAGDANHEAASVERSFMVAVAEHDPDLYGPELTQQPQDVVIADGGWATFTVWGYGIPATETWTWQWQYRTGATGPWADVTPGLFPLDSNGAQQNGLGLRPVSLTLSGYQFRCVVSSEVGTVISAAATLRVEAQPPYFTTWPANQYFKMGDRVIFSAAAQGSGPLSYQWQRNGAVIPGANGAVLDLGPAIQADPASYSVKVTNAAGSVTSGPVRYYLVAPPRIVAQPADMALLQSSSGNLGVGYESEGSVTVQWFHGNVLVPSASYEQQINSAALRLSNVQPADAGEYRVVITNVAGSVESESATLTVQPNAGPQLTDGLGTEVQLDNNYGATLAAGGVGANPAEAAAFAYQWYFNGVLIPGATASSYHVPAGAVDKLGEYYATITNAHGTTVSRTITVDASQELPARAEEWLDAQQADGVVYFLRAAPARIERFNLATEAWLAPWTLPEAPTGFAVTADAWLIAYPSRVDRYARDFSDGANLIAARPSRAIKAVGVIGGHIITVEGDDSTVYYRSHTLAGAFVAETSVYSGPKVNLTFASAARRIYGRNYRGDDRLKSLPLNADGSWGSVPWDQGSSRPSNQGRTMSLAGGAYVGVANAYFFAAADFEAVAGSGGYMDDAIDAAGGGYFVLHPGRISRLDADFRETASLTLTTRGARFFAQGNRLLIFSQPATAGTAPTWRAAAMDALAASPAAPVVDPTVVPVWSPQINADAAGNLAIYSKLHRNVFRWSAAHWGYQPAVGLPNSPNHVAVSPMTGGIYYEARRNYIERANLEDGSIQPFRAGLSGWRGLLVTGNLLFADHWSAGSGSPEYELFVDGTTATTGPTTNGASRPLAWSGVDRRIYGLSESSPPGFFYRSVLPETKTVGGEVRAPEFNNRTYQPPISPSPDGKFILLGGGGIFEQANRTQVGSMPGNIIDAAWTAGRVYVLRTGSAGTAVKSYARPDWRPAVEADFDGLPLGLASLRGDRLLLVTSQAGILRYRMLDAATLTEIDPTAATPPTITGQPDDVVGAMNQPLQLQVHTTGGALPGYQWQVRLAGTSEWTNLIDDANIQGAQSGRLVVGQQPANWHGARFRVTVTNSHGAVTSASAAVTAAGQAGVVAIATSENHIVFTRADGSVWSLGRNDVGQLGDGSIISRARPFLLSFAGRAYAEQESTHVIALDGTLWQTGRNPTGYLPFTAPYYATTLRALDADVVSAGLSAPFVLKQDGTVWLKNTAGDQFVAEDISAMAITGSLQLFIRADGTLWRLKMNQSTPPGAGLSGPLEGAVQIATGVRSAVTSGENVFFIKTDGTLWAMGRNDFGQLGDGTKVDRADPVRIDHEVRSVAANTDHTLYVKTDGSVWAMGNSSYGQLGDGTVAGYLATASQATPVQVADAVAAVAVSGASSFIVKTDGSLWAVGVNEYGKFGREPAMGGAVGYPAWELVASGVARKPEAPVDLVAPSTGRAAGVRLNWTPTTGAATYEIWRNVTNAVEQAVRIADGITLPLYYDAEAQAGVEYHYWVRAVNQAGQSDFSTAGRGSRGLPQAPVITQQPVATATVEYQTVMLRVEATGDPSPSYQWQQLGEDGLTWSNLTESSSLAYTQFTGTHSTQLVLGYPQVGQTGSRFRCLVASPAGQVISATAVLTVTPTPPPSVAPRIFLSQAEYTLMLGTPAALSVYIDYGSDYEAAYEWRKDGTVIPGATQPSLGFSSVTLDEAGSYVLKVTNSAGSTESSPIRVSVIPAATTLALVAGNGDTIALQDNDHAVGMGANTDDQLGIGSYIASLPMPQFLTLYGAVAISAGGSHTLYLEASGRVQGMGANDYGQSLSVRPSSWPVKVTAIAAGGFHSLALFMDGTVRAAGRNEAGQLGDGTTVNRSQLVVVATEVQAIAAGAGQSFFIKHDGSLWVAGRNEAGQLGTGDLADRLVPVQVATEVVAVASGTTHTLFIRRDGTLWGMGSNEEGKLGNRLPVGAQALTPLQIAEGVVKCSAGAGHSAFIKTDGTLWTMGRNDRGQLGRGTASPWENTPAQIAAAAAAVAVGYNHTAYLDAEHAIWTVGDNTSGQLGYATPQSYASSPARLWAVRYAGSLAAPTEVTATQGTRADGVRLTWRSATAHWSYTIYRGLTPVWAEAVPVAADFRDLTFIDHTANPGEIYYYWIGAVAADLAPALSSPVVGRAGVVANLPVIVTQNPVGAYTAYAGGTLNFSFTVTGPGSRIYQVRKNGSPVGGPVESPYTMGPTIGNLVPDDAGVYDVVISNGYGSVVSAPVTVSVAPGSQLITFGYLGDRPYTAIPITLVASASSRLPVVFSVVAGPATVTGDQLTLHGLGEVTVRARQAGNAYYQAAEQTQKFTVSKANLEPRLINLLQVYDGHEKPVGLGGVPAGVPYVIDYEGQLAPPIEVGRYRVSVRIDELFYQGIGTAILTILPAFQSIDFPALLDRYFSETPMALNATASSGRPVEFSIVAGAASIQGNQLTMEDVGYVTVRASVAAGGGFDAAPAVDRSFTILASYTTWLADRFTTEELGDPSISGPNADPDGDGLPNLVEYALGLGPKVADASGVPEVSATATEWTYTYTRPVERADLAYAVEASTTLTAWSTTNVTHTLISTAAGIETWRATYPLGSAANVFFRLKVTQL